MKKTFAALLLLSVIVNIALAAALAYVTLQGCAEIADGRLGVLTRDLPVGQFSGSETLFTLPKGLVVREASAIGADWFEPYRFRLVITSDEEGLVDFSSQKVPANNNGEYYSADRQ